MILKLWVFLYSWKKCILSNGFSNDYNKDNYVTNDFLIRLQLSNSNYYATQRYFFNENNYFNSHIQNHDIKNIYAFKCLEKFWIVI